MYSLIKNNFHKTTLKDIFFLGILCFILFAFLLINSDTQNIAFSNPITCIYTFVCICILILAGWLILLTKSNDPKTSLKLARISLIPILILTLLFPYPFFYHQLTHWQQIISLGLITLSVILFHQTLTKTNYQMYTSPQLFIILLALYSVFFSIVSILHHQNYQNTNPPDMGLYSQIQWNNIHGRFFQSSTSGSNFTTHNSPFLILLAPFYAIYPHPESLIVLKSVLLAFSAFPFYLISKHYLNERSARILSIAYLFFPFIVGQNFNAPHEICFLPTFILFCFYFFIKNKFKQFLFFLLISLSIKEHVAMIPVMFGLYAMVLKKEKQWILTPIILGVFWAVFSIWLMSYFQKIYHVDPAPMWLIEEIKRNFSRSDHSILTNLIEGIKNSNLGQLNNFNLVYLLFSPLAVILPFNSLIWLIGSPELFINLLATHPLTYPTWHYNIVSSCFLLIACAASIRKISIKLYPKIDIPLDKTQEILSLFLLFCILSHFFLWSDYIYIKENSLYTTTMNEAVSLIPREASVSLPKNLAAYFSDRKDYFLLNDSRKGQYLITDSTVSDDISTQYTKIFQSNNIRVYKQIYH